MYGLPEGIDLSFFVGATLVQVCIGENEVILNFDGEVSLMCSSSVRYAGAGKTESLLLADAKLAGAAVLDLLGSNVTEVSAARDGTLALTWSAGDRLELSDSWTEYESYTIRHGDQFIVV